jgi:hypothetical protein
MASQTGLNKRLRRQNAARKPENPDITWISVKDAIEHFVGTGGAHFDDPD